MIKTRLVILTILYFILSSSYAQQYEFGISGVATGYMGDINSTNPFYFKNFGAGLFAKYNLNPTWGVKLSFNQLHLSGNDTDFNSQYQQERRLAFSNKISELALTAEFNFFKYIPGRQLNRYTPYLVAGIAAVMHDPYVANNGNKQFLRKLQLEVDKNNVPVNYDKFALSIPIGVGFKYNLKGPWSIGTEVIYRTAITDNIDNVSQYYPLSVPNPDWENLADPSGNLSINGGKARGDGKIFDGYMTAGLTLTYTIISKKCYWWQ